MSRLMMTRLFLPVDKWDFFEQLLGHEDPVRVSGRYVGACDGQTNGNAQNDNEKDNRQQAPMLSPETHT